MATRKKRQRPPSSTATGRLAILLEDIRDQNRATLEAVHALDVKLTRQMEQLRSDLTARIEALEAAVRILAERVQKNTEDTQKNSDAIDRMRREMAEVRLALQAKGNAEALEALERRVRALEQRLSG